MVDPELDDPCNLDLAPDNKHKAKISGGSPYGIELPCLGTDPSSSMKSTAFRWSTICASRSRGIGNR